MLTRFRLLISITAPPFARPCRHVRPPSRAVAAPAAFHEFLPPLVLFSRVACRCTASIPRVIPTKTGTMPNGATTTSVVNDARPYWTSGSGIKYYSHLVLHLASYCVIDNRTADPVSKPGKPLLLLLGMGAGRCGSAPLSFLPSVASSP